MSESPVTMSLDGDVALVRIDDGKVNALSPAVLDGLGAALDAAEAEAKAVVVAGRPEVFCAGLDLKVIGAGGSAGADLFRRGSETFLRLATFPRPVVVACTGHALAAGAVLLLGADVRIGSGGDYKIGLNEVAIGIPLPELVVELARTRLSSRHFAAACNTARIYSPAEAVEVGFLDRADSADATADALAAAAELAARLDIEAFAATRRVTSRGLAATVRRDAGAV